MPIPLIVNGVTYQYPKLGDENWGQDATNWAIGITQLVNSIDTLINNTIVVGLFELADGSAGTPSLRFQNSLTTGIYRAGSNILSFSSSGTQSGQISATGRLQWTDGSLASPALSFISDTDTGIYRPGANQLALVTGGALALSIDASQNVSIAQDLSVLGDLIVSGSISLNNVTVTGNTTVGDADTDTLNIIAELISNISPDVTNTYDLGLTSKRWRDIYASRNVYSLRSLNGDGTAGAPSISFENDLDTGIYSAGGNGVNVSAGGGQVAGFTSAGLRLVAGSAALPAYSFLLDTDTGLYNSAANTLALATAGIAGLTLDANQLVTIGAAGGIQTHSILGNATLTFPTAGSRAVFQIAHTDTANPASHAALQLTSPGASSGDPYIQFLINTVQNWSAGVDNSDSDKWKISASSTLGSNDYLSITTGGLVTLGLLGGSQIHRVNGALELASSASLGFTQDPLKESTLLDNSTGDVFVLLLANSNIIVDYSIVRGTGKETGQLIMSSDGTNVQVSGNSSAVVDCGVSFSGDINAGNIRLRYTTTSTGSNATMRYSTKRWGD